MDIWNWVEKLQGDLRQAGQAQNAHLLNRLADEVSELQIDRVDALLPEARALGKRRSTTPGSTSTSATGRCATVSATVLKARAHLAKPYRCSSARTARTPWNARSRSA